MGVAARDLGRRAASGLQRGTTRSTTSLSVWASLPGWSWDPYADSWDPPLTRSSWGSSSVRVAPRCRSATLKMESVSGSGSGPSVGSRRRGKPSRRSSQNGSRHWPAGRGDRGERIDFDLTSKGAGAIGRTLSETCAGPGEQDGEWIDAEGVGLNVWASATRPSTGLSKIGRLPRPPALAGQVQVCQRPTLPPSLNPVGSSQGAWLGPQKRPGE